MNISLGFDLPALQKDANGAVNIIKTATVGLTDAADKANNAIKQGTDAVSKGLGSLQTQFRAAQKEALTLASRYGSTSEAALLAAKRAGELKDAVADQKAIINAFSADSKFTVVAGAMQQAAGAASIMTGAMGLLGVKSSETAAMLLKVQSALALTQGLAQLKEMGASFTALAAVVKVDVLPAIMSLNAALSASLVGAIAVAAIAIYGLVNDMNEASDSAARLAEANKGIEDSYKAMSDAVKASYDSNSKVRELEIQGMTDGAAKDKALLDLKIQNLRHESNERFQASNQNIFDQQRLTRELKAIETIRQKDLKAIRDKYAPKKVDSIFTPKMGEIAPRLTGFGSSITSAIQNATAGIKPVDLSNLINYQSLSDKTVEAFTAFKSLLTNIGENLIAPALTSMSQAIGNAIASGANPIEAAGDALLSSLGAFMVKLGAQMIVVGTIGTAFDAAIKSMQWYAAIPLGIALVAAGSAISTIASSGGNGGAMSGGGSSAPSIGNYQPNFNNGMSSSGMTVTDRLYGRDLLLVIDTQGRVKRR